jgi:DNA-directed RNA polymerase subunit H (RpoH/RPB5)
MDLHAPSEVYANLGKLLVNCGAVLDTELEPTSDVVKKLNHTEYILIHSSRPDTDIRGKAKVVACLIAPGSKYSNTTHDFKNLLKVLNKLHVGERMDIIIISSTAVTIHLKKQIIIFRTESEKGDRCIKIDDYEYKNFLIDITKSVNAVTHSIASPDEVLAFTKRHFITIDQLPKILANDAQAIWLGARPGMVVKIHRPSENAGSAVAYRVCVKASTK